MKSEFIIDKASKYNEAEEKLKEYLSKQPLKKYCPMVSNFCTRNNCVGFREGTISSDKEGDYWLIYSNKCLIFDINLS